MRIVMWYLAVLILSVVAISSSQNCDDCDPPPEPVNGSVNVNCGVATYECDVGFYLEQDNNIHTCHNGNWIPSAEPTCTEICSSITKEECATLKQIIVCDADSDGHTLYYDDGKKETIKGNHSFFGDKLHNFRVYKSGKVEFNDGDLSMTVANLSNDSEGVVYDYKMTTNYGLIQRQYLDCLLAQLDEDINVMDFFVLSWKKDGDEFIIQLAILTDYSNRTYAMFIYTDDVADTLIGDGRAGFRRDADSPCYNEVFYNFPILTNSTIEDDKRIFIRRIDNLGEEINCSCDPDNHHCDCLTDYVQCIDGNWDIDCKVYGARLTNGTSGLVEVCYGNTSGYVCDDSWDSNDANVVCGEAGYLNYGAKARRRGEKFDDRDYLLDDVHCNGNEKSLFECERGREIGIHDCGEKEVARAECLSEEDIGICIEPKDNMTIKVKHNNRWKYVCLNFWTNDDARVACNWLGFEDSDNHKVYPADVDSNGTEFWMDYVNCKGDEQTLFECLYILKLGHRAKYCYPNHKKVAGVMCSGTPPDGDDHLCK